MLCDDLEGWKGGVGGRLKRKGTYVHMAGSCCCRADTNITLYSNKNQIK